MPQYPWLPMADGSRSVREQFISVLSGHYKSNADHQSQRPSQYNSHTIVSDSFVSQALTSTGCRPRPCTPVCQKVPVHNCSGPKIFGMTPETASPPQHPQPAKGYRYPKNRREWFIGHESLLPSRFSPVALCKADDDTSCVCPDWDGARPYLQHRDTNRVCQHRIGSLP